LNRVGEKALGYPEVIRIVLSGHTEMAAAPSAVPIAHQFLAKPSDAGMLRLAIERSCHLQALLTDGPVRSMVGAERSSRFAAHLRCLEQSSGRPRFLAVGDLRHR